MVRDMSDLTLGTDVSRHSVAGGHCSEYGYRFVVPDSVFLNSLIKCVVDDSVQ